MRQAEGQLFLLEVADQREDVEAMTLDLLVLRRVKAPYQDVDVQSL